MDLILQAVIVGIVQGLTEFLPVSSSAHLTLLPPLAGWDDPLLNSAAFAVMLHLGTLVALLAYFWRDVVRLVSAGIRALLERRIAGDPDRHLALLLVISIIPAAVVGAVGEEFFDTYFREALLTIPVILVVGALLLAAAERIGRRDHGLDGMSPRDAAIVGGAQALALFPGISRSGITLAAGMVLGLRRDDAARFAFLMGIPIIAGAGLWKSRDLIAAPPQGDELAALMAGMLASTVSGFLAIRFLLRYLRTNSTWVFIAYRLAFAAVIAVLLVVR